MRWYGKKYDKHRRFSGLEPGQIPLSQKDVAGILAPLAGLEYAVIGGAAMMMRGHDRPTGDIDVLVTQDHLEEAVRRLGGKAQPIPNGYSVDVNGIEVDVLRYMGDKGEESLPLAQMAIQESSGTTRMVSPAWLLLTKMIAQRDKDVNDYIAIFNKLTPEERKRAKLIIRDHIPELMDEFKSISMMSKYMPAAPTPAAPAQPALAA